MYTNMADICALRNLRLELQEDAGDDYPDAVMTELLVLRDVCKRLNMSIGQLHDVIGKQGYDGIDAFLDSVVLPSDGIDQIIELGPESVTHPE